MITTESWTWDQLVFERLPRAFRDCKVQASRTLLVHQQQHERHVQDLLTAKQSQDRQIQQIQRCRALESKVKEFKQSAQTNNRTIMENE